MRERKRVGKINRKWKKLTKKRKKEKKDRKKRWEWNKTETSKERKKYVNH